MRVDIPPGTYVITPAGVDNPVVGMTPLLRARQNHGAQPLAECKPVELVPDNYPEYTRVVRAVYVVVASSAQLTYPSGNWRRMALLLYPSWARSCMPGKEAVGRVWAQIPRNGLS